MTLTFSHGHGEILLPDFEIDATCQVRNEVNRKRPAPGKRPGADVVYTLNADGSRGVPYMPRRFPLGNWKVTGIVDHTSEKDRREGYLYPYFIKTDAWQEVDEWSLTPEGEYDAPTGNKVRDYAYGLHHASNSTTTLGCIRVSYLADLRYLVSKIQECFKNSEPVELRVHA